MSSGIGASRATVRCRDSAAGSFERQGALAQVSWSKVAAESGT